MHSSKATTTPYTGDNQQDWLIKKYAFYYKAKDERIWRTDALPLLGTRDGARVNLFENAHYESYPWGEWQTDWQAPASGCRCKKHAIGEIYIPK